MLFPVRGDLPDLKIAVELTNSREQFLQVRFCDIFQVSLEELTKGTDPIDKTTQTIIIRKR